MSVAGVFEVTMNSPMGSQGATLTLQEEGDALSGSFAGPMGSQEFDGGKVDGNNASWAISITSPMAVTLEFTAEVNGDEIKGTVATGAFGTFDFDGKRTG